MVEDWADHSLDMAKDAKNKQEAAEKAYSDADKKLKETLAQLADRRRPIGMQSLPLRAMKNRPLMPWKLKGRLRTRWP